MHKLICPKCKNKVDSNELRCSVCGMRLNVVCPKCGSLNNFGNTVCSECGNVLLKYCGNCGSANLSDATVCRKCNTPLENSSASVKNHNLVKFIENEHADSKLFLPKYKKDKQSFLDSYIKEKSALSSEIISPDKNAKLNESSVSFNDKTEKTEMHSDAEYDLEIVNQEYGTENLQAENVISADIKPLNPPKYQSQTDNVSDVQVTFSENIKPLNKSEYTPHADGFSGTQFTSDTAFSQNIAPLNEPEYTSQTDSFSGTQFTSDTAFSQNIAPLNEPENILQTDSFSDTQFTSDIAFSENIAPLNEPEYTSQTDSFSDVQLNGDINFSGDITPLNTSENNYISYETSDNNYVNADNSENEINYLDDINSAADSQQTYAENVNYENQYSGEQTYTDNYSQNTESYSSGYYSRNKGPELLLDIKTNQDYISTERGIIEFSDSQSLLNMLMQVFEQPNKKIIAVGGEEGAGKTTVVNAFLMSLYQKQITCLKSECSESTKTAPYGAVRDALLKLFSLPDFQPNMQSFMSEQTKDIYASQFTTLSPQEILDFMNFLYPSVTAEYKTVYENKLNIYSLLEKVFKSISVKNNFVYVIDNYELIDSSSRDLINYLIKSNKLNNKVILIYNEKQNVRYYFDDDLAEKDIFATLVLNNMNENQVREFVQKFVNTMDIPQEVLNVISQNGKGNVFFAEQYLALLYDKGNLLLNQNVMTFSRQLSLPEAPDSFEALIKLRLNEIKSWELKNCLYTLSVIGSKVDAVFFTNVMGYTQEQAADIFKQLTDSMYIYKSGNNDFSFKNNSLRNIIFNEAKECSSFAEICNKIYATTEKFGLSNSVFQAEILKYTDNKEALLQALKTSANLAANLGDEYVYTECYEQWLNSTGYSYKSEEITDVQLNILEALGKIYSFDKPQDAIKYLTDSVTVTAKNGNFPKVIELAAYMIKACNAANDYNGVIETVDMVVSSGAVLQPIEKAVILSKKMLPMFILGNCEAAINLANNDILPVFEERLAKLKDFSKMEKLFEVWFDVSVNLANAYSLQGNIQSLNILSNIEETIKMNNIRKNEYIVRINLAKAFAKAVVGSVDDSFAILSGIPVKYIKSNNILKLWYNLILAFAKTISENNGDLKQKLGEYLSASDDNADELSKHVLKTFLAVITFNSGYYSNALDLFKEQLNYFAKEQIVTGALICWLYIAKINLLTENIDEALNIADKALDIAQNPTFSQHHISIYIQQLLAEINIAKGDDEAAKMYLEKGLTLAKQFGLELTKINLHSAYLNLFRQIIKSPNSADNETVNKMNQIFKTSLNIVKTIRFSGLYEKISADYDEFINYCYQNSYVLT